MRRKLIHEFLRYDHAFEYKPQPQNSYYAWPGTNNYVAEKIVQDPPLPLDALWTPEILIRQRNQSRKELGSNFVQQNVRILEEQLEEEHNVED